MSYSVLIIDDSEVIRSVLNKTIQFTTIEFEKILEASSGKEALELLQNNWVDIIFSDINMPEMNGIEMIRELRENDEFKDIPIIVISTEGDEKTLDQLVQLGVSGFLKKPFRPEDISSLIFDTLGKWDEE